MQKTKTKIPKFVMIRALNLYFISKHFLLKETFWLRQHILLRHVSMFSFKIYYLLSFEVYYLCYASCITLSTFVYTASPIGFCFVGIIFEVTIPLAINQASTTILVFNKLRTFERIAYSKIRPERILPI